VALRRAHLVVAVIVVCGVATGLGVKWRGDVEARRAKLRVCRDWEKVAADRLAAGQFSAARGALVSVRTTCDVAELDDSAAAGEENAKLIAIELSVREKEGAAGKQTAAPTSPSTPLAPAERARALAGLDELHAVIRRQTAAQGRESEQKCLARLEAESARIKAAEAKVGLSSMGARVDDNSDVEGAPPVVHEKLGLDTVRPSSGGRPTTRFSSAAPHLGWTPDEFVWACVGCVTSPDDIAAMSGDPRCRSASTVLDDMAERVNASK